MVVLGESDRCAGPVFRVVGEHGLAPGAGGGKGDEVMERGVTLEALHWRRAPSPEKYGNCGGIALEP